MRARLVSLAALTWLLACGHPPSQQVEAARQALTAAEEMGAAEYAPDQLTEAREALKRAEEEERAQRERLFLLRDYREAEQAAAEAERLAQETGQAVAPAKETVRTQALTRLEEIGTDLDRARSMFESLRACPRRPRAETIDMEQARMWLEATDGRLQEIQATFNAGDFLAALRDADAMAEDLAETLTDLAAARSETGC